MLTMYHPRITEGHTRKLDNSPAMIGVPSDPVHRAHDLLGMIQHIAGCVARPVSHKEMRANAKAIIAKEEEWNLIRSKNVWDGADVKTWVQVCAEARTDITSIHVGSASGIGAERCTQLPADDPRRTIKFRVVIQGNLVIDQS